MTVKHNLVAIFAGTALLLASGCVRSSAHIRIKVPTSATDVKFLHPSSHENGVKFSIQIQPSSYKYIDGIRRQITELGYTLCKKSAISKWQPLPALDTKKRSSQYWIVEMYTTKNRKKFMLLRIDESLNNKNQSATQKFTIASQDIPSGQQDLSNINEFCGI